MIRHSNGEVCLGDDCIHCDDWNRSHRNQWLQENEFWLLPLVTIAFVGMVFFLGYR